MRILAADPQAGEGGLSVERSHNIIPARDGQFVRAEGVKPFCASISRLATVPMEWLLHILFV